MVIFLDDSAVTAEYRLTVETKSIKDAAVITKLRSSSLEGNISEG